MTSIVESKIEAKKDSTSVAVNREKTCPLMLRVFLSNGRHNSAQDYRKGATPPNELQIYTWMDATLKELTSLISNLNSESREPGTTFDYAAFFPDLQKPLPKQRELGIVTIGHKSFDDSKTLNHLGFIIGDYIDVAITPPGRMLMQRRPMNRPYNRM